MRVNYPGLKKEYAKIKQSYANRGMDLENLLNETNQYYLEKDIAVIYKKPTPIGINKVRYENNKQIIKEAYFKTQSTLDYNGIYKGYYVDFDAKTVVEIIDPTIKGSFISNDEIRYLNKRLKEKSFEKDLDNTIKKDIQSFVYKTQCIN